MACYQGDLTCSWHGSVFPRRWQQWVSFSASLQDMNRLSRVNSAERSAALTQDQINVPISGLSTTQPFLLVMQITLLSPSRTSPMRPGSMQFPMESQDHGRKGTKASGLPNCEPRISGRSPLLRLITREDHNIVKDIRIYEHYHHFQTLVQHGDPKVSMSTVQGIILGPLLTVPQVHFLLTTH